MVLENPGFQGEYFGVEFTVNLQFNIRLEHTKKMEQIQTIYKKAENMCAHDETYFAPTLKILLDKSLLMFW